MNKCDGNHGAEIETATLRYFLLFIYFVVNLNLKRDNVRTPIELWQHAWLKCLREQKEICETNENRKRNNSGKNDIPLHHTRAIKRHNHALARIRIK